MLDTFYGKAINCSTGSNYTNETAITSIHMSVQMKGVTSSKCDNLFHGNVSDPANFQAINMNQ